MLKKIIYSILLLLVGLAIYILSMRGIIVKNNILTIFTRNYIPDILWTLSFYSFSTLFSKSLTKYYIIFTALYVITLSIIFEYLQFTGIVLGTFDLWDIIVYIISTIIAAFIEKYYWRDTDEEKNH